MIHVEHHGPVIAIRMARRFLGRPLAWATAYWVDGLLVDTGPYCAAGELIQVLAQLHVDQVVITHSHEDNIGGLAAVHRRFPHAPIYASSYAIPTIQDPTRLHLQFYRRLVWGVPRGVSGVRPVEGLEDMLRTPDYAFRVVETPGHTRDHVSLYEPTQRWLFSGDAFIGGHEQDWARESDLFGVIGSLHTLDSLRPERLFPSSGEVRRNPRPELSEKINHLMRLSKEVARLEAAGMDVEEIVECLFKGESRLRLWTGGHFSAAHLVDACRSYNTLTATGTGDAGQVRRNPFTANRPLPSDSAGSSANESADRGDMVR